MNRNLFVVLILTVTFLITACNSLGFPRPTVIPTAKPTLTTTPLLKIGCATTTCRGSIDAIAWLDENSNGVRDNHEPPLPWVRFRIEGANEKPATTKVVIQGQAEEQWQELEGYYTDANGAVQILIWLTGAQVDCSLPAKASCDAAQVELQTRMDIFVYPEIPPGYRLTTKPKLALGDGQNRAFGFAPLSPMVTPSLQP